MTQTQEFAIILATLRVRVLLGELTPEQATKEANSAFSTSAIVYLLCPA